MPNRPPANATPFSPLPFTCRPDKDQREVLNFLFDKYAIPAVEYVTEGMDGELMVKKPRQTIPITNLNGIHQLCGMLDVLILPDHPKMGDSQVLEALFVHSTVWSIGAAIIQRGETKDRDKFSDFMKKLSGMATQDGQKLPPTQLPAKSLFEYCFDVQVRLGNRRAC